MSSEQRRRFAVDGFCVIDPCVGKQELEAFKTECTALSRGVDLDETDCVVDLWAAQALDDHHPARVDPAVYKRLRSRVVAASQSSTVSEGSIVVSTIFGQLASLAAQAFSSIVHGHVDGTEETGLQDKAAELDTRLFNEHYVVKPAESSMVFGWHTDKNEQLQMCLNQPALPYISVWLPLCNTADDNGTLEILPRSAPQPPRDADKSHPFFLSLVSEVEGCTQGLIENRDKVGAKGDHNISRALLPSADSATAAVCAPSTTDEGTGNEKSIAVHVPVICKRIQVRAGGAVLFASDIWHRSGKNRSTAPRQVFYAQFTCGVLRSDGTLGPSYRAPGLPQEQHHQHQPGVGSNGDGDDVSEGGPTRKCRRLSGPLAFAVPTDPTDVANF